MMKETIYETPWVEMIFLGDDIITSSTTVEGEVTVPDLDTGEDED